MSGPPRWALTSPELLGWGSISPRSPSGWGPISLGLLVPTLPKLGLLVPTLPELGSLSLHHHLHPMDIYLSPLCPSHTGCGAEVFIAYPYYKCQSPGAGSTGAAQQVTAGALGCQGCFIKDRGHLTPTCCLSDPHIARPQGAVGMLPHLCKLGGCSEVPAQLPRTHTAHDNWGSGLEAPGGGHEFRVTESLLGAATES